MSIKLMKRATFLCPTVTTGGPEAIHQVAQVLNEEGLPTDIAYYGDGGRLRLDGARLVVEQPAENPCLEAYARYRPVVSPGALLRRHHLLVLPEVLAGSAPVFRGASVAVWWLSIDNAPIVADPAALRLLLADREVRHFTQSAYAEDFLRRTGGRGSDPLGDYTDPRFAALRPQAPNVVPGVAYNPAKGAELADAFFAANPGLRGVPIRGMTKDEVADLLCSTQVYVDFGHFPGKDRLPREAAAGGAVVFLRRRGAGAYAEDFPVPDFFRFDEEDLASGELARRIAAVQSEPASFFAQQEPLRTAVQGEQETLRAQVRALLGSRPAA
ncbi:hypothetical protein DQ237_15945 [Blastococcus sp. TF02-8]|uniref:hypothetical protein n=1 Tax=Blastococcus sp. TF02-8 TaxID=2250574 RepID=UPI000DEB60E1|nr:hypothetical protein [Blastococcus sp. TF02-8]RBY95174.1 hypothetical protein DQ237_15945 [Blastococcus sp. TF02-8]